MIKLYRFIKRVSFIQLVFSLIVVIIAVGIKRRYNVDIQFVRTFISLFIISFVIGIAFEMFKYERIPTVLRIILGYILLFYSTLIIRRAFGPWLFKTSLVILLFTIICTIIYFIALFSIMAKYKLEEKELNKALKDMNVEDE